MGNEGETEGTIQRFRKRHRGKGEPLMFSAIVGSLFVVLSGSWANTATMLAMSGGCAVLLAVGWWFGFD